MTVKHLYVHIPFCRSRCAYCDFVSEALGPHARAGRVEAYLLSLREELARMSPLLDPPLETVYLGGGTPTTLPRGELVALVRELSGLLRPAKEGSRGANAARSACGPTPDVSVRRPAGPAQAPEFTMEANPGTIDRELLRELASSGVSRLSLGVQSFSRRLRRNLGRQVGQSELEDCVAAIRASGWEEWNIDLIHGIPGQSWEEAAADIDRAVAAGPSHISLYDLTYTSSYRDTVRSLLGADSIAAAEDFAEQNYARASGRLVEAGFARYEVSNFALPGHECRHNLAYWSGEDYIGVGAGAVSTIGGMRRTNPGRVEEYLAGGSVGVEFLDERTRLWEKAMLGLRTALGVDETAVRSVIDAHAEERLVRQGCLERRCGKLRLNPGFLDISNSIISALLASPEGR